MKRKNRLLRFLPEIALLCFALSAFGCGSWLSEFDQWSSIAESVFVQVLDMVGLQTGTPVNQALVSKSQADVAALESLANSVNAAINTPNIGGACAEFNLGVQTLAGDLTDIEQLAGVKAAGTQSEIADSVQFAQQTFKEIEAPIAACSTAPSFVKAKHVLIASTYQVRLSPEDFVQKWNGMVEPRHKIHLHSRIVRWLTFNHLQ